MSGTQSNVGSGGVVTIAIAPRNRRSSFPRRKIAANISEFPRAAKETPFPDEPLLIGRRSITHLIDLLGRQVGGFRGDFCAGSWRRPASAQSQLDQAADGVGAGFGSTAFAPCVYSRDDLARQSNADKRVAARRRPAASFRSFCFHHDRDFTPKAVEVKPCSLYLIQKRHGSRTRPR
jgi:hypothetical protein